MEDKDSQILDKILERFKLLEEATLNNEYAEFVYEFVNPETGEDTLMYLPSIIEELLRDTANGVLNLYTFSDIWQKIVEDFGKLTKISDGTTLEILDVAIVWISKGTDQTLWGTKTKPPPFDVLVEGMSEESYSKTLHDFILFQISQTLMKERDSEAVFSQKNIIDSARMFSAIEKNGIEQQKRSVKALNLIEENYIRKDIPTLEAFDDELEEISYTFSLVHTTGEEKGKLAVHGPSFEKEFFDFGLKVGPIMPFVVANMDEVKISKNMFRSIDNRWFKVYKPTPKHLEIYHQNKWTGESNSHTIIMFVFMGDDEKAAEEINPKDFIQVIYSFKKGVGNFGSLTVTLNKRNVELLIERLNRHLIGYKVVDSAEFTKVSYISQKFLIPGLQVDDAILMHMISMDVSASTMLRIKEVGKPWSLKKIIKFGVFLLGKIIIRLRSEVVETSTRPVKTNGIFHAIVKGDKIVTVNIEAQNMEQYEMARFFILKVLGKYTLEYRKIFEFYKSFFEPSREEITPMNEMGELVEEGEVKNIKLLRYADPSVWWDSNYSRPVAPQADLQVKPIKESEIEKYRAEGRDVIRWPVRVTNQIDGKVTEMPISVDPYTGKPLIVYYTASSRNKPYITLVKNPGPNGNIYPLIPKCQASPSDIFTNDLTWEITIHSTEKGKTNKGDIVTLKVLDAGRHSTVQGSITQYIGVKSLLRIGMRKSKSSFLRCVLVAQNVKGFREIHETPESEEKVKEYRELLGTFALVCKQENPDLSVEEIRKELEDPNVFLDPSRHYRALEELFQINIFTASPNSNKELMLEPPRSIGPYFRSKRNYELDSVIVIKLESQKSRRKIEYQCELIGINEEGVSFLFNEGVTRSLEKAVDSLTKSLSVSPSCKMIEVEGLPAEKQTITVESSNERKLEIPKNILRDVVAQELDSLGKLRAIKVKIEEGKFFWCIVPPMEPLMTDSEINQDIVLANIEATSAEAYNVLKRMQKYKTGDLRYTPCDGMLVGIWTYLENLYVFIPLVPSKWNTKYQPVRFDCPYLPQVVKTVSQVEGESYTETCSRLRRVMAILIQVVKRLYVASNLSVEEFANQHMIIDENSPFLEVDPPTHLIPYSEFEDLRKHFMRILPTFFQKGKLICDSRRLYDNLVSRLKTFRKVIDDEVTGRIIPDDPLLREKGKPTVKPPGDSKRVTKFPPYFEEFHVTLRDFKVHPGTHQAIYLSLHRYMLEKKLTENYTPTLVKKLKVTLLRHKDPILYMYEDSNIQALYIVQNVLDGDASRAATLAKYWNQNHVNLGYYCPGHINSGDVINLKAESIKIEDPHSPMIIFYASGEAAALLSLNSDE